MKHIALFLTLTLGAVPAVAQDAERGEKLFKRCAACHQIGEGAKNRTGPVLTGVIGRSAGNFDGYAYGKSMQAAGEMGLVWDEEQLFDYLADPRKYLRNYLGNPKAMAKMSFKLKKEADRRDVIAYLDTFSSVGDVVPVAPTADTDPDENGHLNVTPKGKVCVRNRSQHSYLFAVEGDPGKRMLQGLQPGERLCVSAGLSGTGIVSVYEREDSLEGCSRIVASDATEDLIKYVDFDRCFWSSNT